MWAMDNWIYSTINLVRLRWTPTGVLREPTGSNGGQWGVTQDNYGKPWFQAGASGMPGYFQTPVAYGNFPNPEQFEPDLEHHLGRAGAHRRHAGRHECRAHAGRLACARDGLGRQRHLPRRSPAEGHGRRLLLRRNRRARRPPSAPGEDRRPDAAAERLSAVRVHSFDRSALPSGGHDDGAGRHDVHHGHVPRHHPGVAVVGAGHVSAADASSSTSSTRS